MASTYTIYKTIAGDTWDLIAYQQLGDEKYMRELIEANPALSEILRFDAGTEIKVPVLPTETVENLPFWHSDDDNTIWAEEAE